jgi:hypothetical protein
LGVTFVSTAFSLSRFRCTHLSDPSLHDEITEHTGDAAATSGILRSLDRFSGDSSIDRYEITPQQRNRGAARARGIAWNVRAVRS